jgi:hypothetical protein
VPPFSTLRTSDGDAVVAEDTVELLRDGADRRRLFSYKLVLDRIPPVVPAAGSLAGDGGLVGRVLCDRGRRAAGEAAPP